MSDRIEFAMDVPYFDGFLITHRSVDRIMDEWRQRPYPGVNYGIQQGAGVSPMLITFGVHGM